ncbi:MAG TPA: hypothetical protein VGB63_02750 [Pedobacter sp.]|jgi:hypothetical protein
MKFNKSIILCTSVLLAFGCTPPVKPEQLYGEWKYTKVESPNQNPPYSMPAEEIKKENPSIKFIKDKDLIIVWGGKTLSYGKFRMEDRMIRYKENLPGGITREFPFLIKQITNEKLVFETMNQDVSRITAVKKK